MKNKIILLLLSTISISNALLAQSALLNAEKMAATVLFSNPDSLTYSKENLWLQTGEGKYYKYIQKIMDSFISDDGTIRTYNAEEYNLDNIVQGSLCIKLYQVTGKEKYKHAANKLREQLRAQPRTTEGGFWHKKNIRIKCGLMVYIWLNRFMHNTKFCLVKTS